MRRSRHNADIELPRTWKSERENNCNENQSLAPVRIFASRVNSYLLPFLLNQPVSGIVLSSLSVALFPPPARPLFITSSNSLAIAYCFLSSTTSSSHRKQLPAQTGFPQKLPLTFHWHWRSGSWTSPLHQPGRLLLLRDTCLHWFCGFLSGPLSFLIGPSTRDSIVSPPAGQSAKQSRGENRGVCSDFASFFWGAFCLPLCLLLFLYRSYTWQNIPPTDVYVPAMKDIHLFSHPTPDQFAKALEKWSDTHRDIHTYTQTKKQTP